MSHNHSLAVPRQPLSLMYRVYKHILPQVDDQLNRWKKTAECIPDTELKTQALASINSKKFHCQGGAVYAAARMEDMHILIPLIVALQTISDYLDNLCDRSTSLDPADFRLLHQSMLDAVDPQASVQNYYALREEQEDGGYLHELVRTCQSCICLLPAYKLVQQQVRELVGLYGDLQVYKHIHPAKREEALLAWWKKHQPNYPQLYWNEFAAATGSTLGMFMLFVSACDTGLTEEAARDTRQQYFPYICGLHILLDYFIDQEEDRQGGDLNFCHYYENQTQLQQRLQWMVEQARSAANGLSHANFHRMIVEGLVALYLSDPKIRQQEQVKAITRRLLRKSPATRLFFWFNSIWIRHKK